MSVENDLVRVRQEIERLKRRAMTPGTGGLNVFITYHASNLDATPANATGDGTTGGWHRTYVTGDNWMATKTALTDIEGTWSDPMAIRGLPGVDGNDAVVYYIKPTTGTAIKNGQGTLTIEAHLITGGDDAIITAGSIKLYDPSNNEVTVANGYATGSDGYTGVLDATDINLSKVITLKNGPTGDPLDTITLIDVLDGDDGDPGLDGDDGTDGVDGTPVLFQGSYADVAALIAAKGALQDGWAYYNTTDGKSYVYYAPSWYQMTIDGVDGEDGQDGLSIVWHGDAASPDPSWEILNHCYRDSDNGYVYIWNGAAWELMVLDGDDGTDGTDGEDGLSVFITYHDNDYDDEPADPTGDGTTGGWHTTPTSAANWMSQKIAASASEGTWGDPILITAIDGIVGSVESNNGLAWVQEAGPGDWTPSGTATTLTVTFYQGGAAIGTRSVVITRSDATLTAPAPGADVQGITYTKIGDNTSAITIQFEHVASGIIVSETVYAIVGADEGDGSGLSDDIPWLTGITFVGNTGSGKVGWTAGTIDYGGTTYNITSKAVADGNTNSYIYWDPAVSTTTFQTTNDLATAIGTGRWVVCKNIVGKAWPAAAHKVLLAGLIQAATLSAISAFLGEITSGTITLSLGGNTRLRIDSTGLAISNDAGANWTWVIKNVGGVVGMYADILAANQILTNMINGEAVTNPKIADDSTTIYGLANTPDTLQLTYGTEVTAQSLAMTSGTGVAQNTFQVDLASTNSSSAFVAYGLWRGTTLIAGCDLQGPSYSGWYVSSSYPVRAFIQANEIPGSGSNTYTLKLKNTTSGITPTAAGRILVYNEPLGK